MSKHPDSVFSGAQPAANDDMQSVNRVGGKRGFGIAMVVSIIYILADLWAD